MLVWRFFIAFITLTTTLGCASFEHSPYFQTFGQCNFRPLVGGRFYDNISHLEGAKQYKSRDLLVDLNLGMRCLPSVEVELELDFSKTHKLPFGLQRTGAGARYLLLDDIGGDVVTLTLGAQAFFVPTRNMRDVSSPYHSQGNLELNVAMGKEWFGMTNYATCLWGFVGVGDGNRGRPWIRPELHLQTQFSKALLGLYSKGYVGLGQMKEIVLSQFDNGYANIKHRSIDIGAQCQLAMGVWGDLNLHYEYRVFAYSYPERASIFYLLYRLPFSVF